MDSLSKKLKILKELDSKTDWEAAIIQQNMKPKPATTTSQRKEALQKLTKSQKKQLKLEKQQQAIQESLKAKNIETIVFSNPDSVSAKRKRQIINDKLDDAKDANVNMDTPGIEIDMRKTQFEIMKFGMNSLKAKDLEDAETSLAVSLGARPNKRPSVNYKELQDQRKKERALQKEEANASFKPKLKVPLKKKSQGDTSGPGKQHLKRDKNVKKQGGRNNGQRRSSKWPRNRNKT